MELQKLEISKEEMDYISQRFELRDHKEIFNWAIKLLHDIAKLDEKDWLLTFQKCKINKGAGKLKVDYLKYNPVHYQLENLSPIKDGYRRLQSPEFFDKSQKIND